MFLIVAVSSVVLFHNRMLFAVVVVTAVVQKMRAIVNAREKDCNILANIYNILILISTNPNSLSPASVRAAPKHFVHFGLFVSVCDILILLSHLIINLAINK